MIKKIVGMVAIVSLSSFAESRVPNRFEITLETMRESIRQNIRDVRDAHPHAHGCVTDVDVAVSRDLPDNLNIGFFTRAKTYKAMFRSSAPDELPFDGAPGLALKILLDEEDQRALLPVFGEEQVAGVPNNYYKSFDILTIARNKEFFVETLADYPAFFAAKGLAKQAAVEAAQQPNATAQTIGVAAWNALQQNYIAPAGGKPRPREGRLLAALAAVHPKNVLQETYNSWVPSLYGNQAVKYQLEPCTPVNPDQYQIPNGINANPRENPQFVTDILKYELRRQNHCYKLKVQVHRPGMPTVEDAVAAWPEGEGNGQSNYVEIATVTIPRKVEGRELGDGAICEKASFHPGHTSALHYPIGDIQRARIGDATKEGIYTAIAKRRNANRAQR